MDRRAESAPQEREQTSSAFRQMVDWPCTNPLNAQYTTCTCVCVCMFVCVNRKAYYAYLEKKRYKCATEIYSSHEVCPLNLNSILKTEESAIFVSLCTLPQSASDILKGVKTLTVTVPNANMWSVAVKFVSLTPILAGNQSCECSFLFCYRLILKNLVN